MNTLKAIIVDDELAARKNLNGLLNMYCPEVSVVAMCEDMATGLEAINTLDFDVLFLDINLGNKTGFDLIAKVDNAKNFATVFVTAYDQYALNAFGVDAIDYLLKPVFKEHLTKCIAKVKNLKSSIQLSSNILETLNSLKSREPKRISVPGKEGNDIIPVGQIIAIEADGSYTRIKLDNEKELYSSKNLKHYETLLEDNAAFMRVHKSYIINTSQIIKIIKSYPPRIVLCDNSVVPLSEQMKDKVYAMFE